MILSPKQLRHFDNFKLDKCIDETDTSKYGYLSTTSSKKYDKFKIDYIEEYKTFWGAVRERTWSKTIKFLRSEAPSETEGYITYTMDNDALELYTQLDEVVKGQWHSISEENMEFFKEKYPERLI